MGSVVLTPLALRAGIWSAVAESDDEPSLVATYQGHMIDGLEISAHGEKPGAWLVRVPVPAEAVSDGVHTILVNETGSDDIIGQFSLLAGDALGEDIRAEVELLRAELDLLKRAFRRHCVETT